MNDAKLKEVLAETAGLALTLARKEMAELDRRITELTARPTLAWRGVWKQRSNYAEGDAVTDKGALWVCTNAVTGARPGASHCWKLAVKSGALKDEGAT